MNDSSSATKATHHEYVGEGYSVIEQYCDFVLPNGFFCNVYLGVNYPLDRCSAHRKA